MTKGTPVIEIRPWNLGRNADTFTVVIQRLTIESLGKKQGSATANEGGRFIQRRIYPREIGVSIFAEADMTDASILEVARKIQTEGVARCERIMAHPSFPTQNHGYQNAIRANLADLQKPILVKRYEDLAR